jgi:hypothetical protein
MANPTQTRRAQATVVRPLALATALALGAAASMPASAQERSPYYFGAAQAISHDSNIFRAADGAAKIPDLWSTTSLLAGLDQPIGRQRLFADLAARYNKYQDVTQLDHTGYTVGAGIDWSTIERLSGRLAINASQVLANYAADNATPTTQKNLERANEALATVRFGGDISVLNLLGTLSHRDVQYSLASSAGSEVKRDLVGLGIRYRPSSLLVLGAGVRHSEGRYRNVDDKYKRDDVDLTATWEASGASRVDARMTFSKEDHERISARDLSTATGALSWTWTPTGKLRFITEISRDSGSEINQFSSLGSAINVIGDNSRLSNQLLLQGFYEATAKILLNATVRYTDRDLVNTLTLGSGGTVTAAGSDQTTALQIGARYDVTRTIRVGCSVGHESRTADSAVSYDYSANTASCYAQILLR